MRGGSAELSPDRNVLVHKENVITAFAVSVRQKMVESLNSNEAKTRILHIGDDVERDSQRPGK